MKRFLIISVLALMAAVSAKAQYADVASYKNLKDRYPAKGYVQQINDPYSVAWSSVLGFFVPGSSQLVMGETVRGLIFLGSSAICSSLIRSFADDLSKVMVVDADGTLSGFTDEVAGRKALTGLLCSLAVDLGISIWSCIDAGNVAKVKNRYYQVAPSVSFAPAQGGSLQPAAGMSFSMNF